jgi:hypothetical protein
MEMGKSALCWLTWLDQNYLKAGPILQFAENDVTKAPSPWGIMWRLLSANVTTVQQ